MSEKGYRMIYKPKGMALEYAPLALNPYIGCNHGCTYCYGPAAMRRPDFHDVIRPRKDFLKKLALDIRDMKAENDKRQVLLSFATDPYNELEPKLKLTRNALMMLSKAEIPFTVLTKSDFAEDDFDLYSATRDSFGVSLTTMNVAKADRWEPDAAKPWKRSEQLERAKRDGISTWVSLEPVMDSVEAMAVIYNVHEFTDVIKIGKLNHQQPEKPIDWQKFAFDAVELCEKLGQKYILKDSLAKYLGAE